MARNPNDARDPRISGGQRGSARWLLWLLVAVVLLVLLAWLFGLFGGTAGPTATSMAHEDPIATDEPIPDDDAAD